MNKKFQWKKILRMTNLKKRIIKHVIALLVIAAVTGIIEVLCFDYKGVSEDNYYNKYTANGYYGYKYTKYSDSDYMYYEFVTDGKYVDKLYLTFVSDNDFSYTVSAIKCDSENSENDNIKKIDDKAYLNFTQAVTNVKKNVDKIIIKIDIKDIPQNDRPVIINIATANEFTINWYRVCFIFIVLCLIYMIAVCRNIVTNHIEIAFFAMCVSLGLMIIVMSPEKFMSWDEQIHFNRSYMISYSDNVEYSEGAYLLNTLKVPVVNTIEEKSFTQTLVSYSNTQVQNIEKDTNYVDYKFRAYLPQAFGLKFARTVNMPLAKGVWLGKFLNLLCYSLIMAFAIKMAKIGKRAIFCIGMLPTAVFLASSFSYDAFVTAFLMLGFVLIINEYVDTKDRINWKNVALAVLCIVLGSFSKAVYVPMLILLCFIPKNKFINKKQRRYFILTVILVFLVMMSTFVLPALTNAVSNIDVNGDTRGGDTSVTRQINYIIGNPFKFVGLLFSSIVNSIATYFLGYNSRTCLYFMGTDKDDFYIMSVVLTVFVTLTEKQRDKVDKKLKILLGVMLAGIAVLIWTALYLDFTPVGANVINGVQPRYYIPIMLPMMMLFSTDKIKCNIGKLAYNRIVLGINLFVLSGCIYQLILLQYCS